MCRQTQQCFGAGGGGGSGGGGRGGGGVEGQQPRNMYNNQTGVRCFGVRSVYSLFGMCVCLKKNRIFFSCVRVCV